MAGFDALFSAKLLNKQGRGLLDAFTAHQTPMSAPMVAPGHPDALPSAYGLPGGFRGAQEGLGRYVNTRLSPEQYGAEGRAGTLAGRYDSALADPRGQAGLFQSFYGDAANALAAPAMRDFRNTLAEVQGNTAARFGGNASSEESRNIYNTSDLFSRNLAEQIAGLAPQAVNAGMNYTSQLGQAAGNAADERDRLSQMILSGIGGYGAAKKKTNLGGILGGIAGAVLPGAKQAMNLTGFTGG